MPGFAEERRNPARGNEEGAAYHEDPRARTASELSDLRASAGAWLEEVLRVGYRGVDDPRAPLPGRRTGEPLPGPAPARAKTYQARLGAAGQTVRIGLDGPRSPGRGYREISVSDEPLRADAAVLAALTALEGRPLDIGVLRETLSRLLPSRGESFGERWRRISQGGLADGALARGHLMGRRYRRSLDYVLALLRHHRPGFDDLPPEERANLIVATCVQIDGFLEVLRRLVSLLEHGKVERRRPAAARTAARDVRAAVLKDVDNLTNRRIGEELRVPLPADFPIKGDHTTVRKMVVRGRKLLETALGEDGWQSQAQAMKDEAARWRSLNEAQRRTELDAAHAGHLGATCGPEREAGPTPATSSP